MKFNEHLFDLPETSMSEKSEMQLPSGKPRLKTACRDQYEIHNSTLDMLIEEDHVVRNIWAYVDNLDLSSVYSSIKSTVGNAGRPAIDPKILVTLWLYATVEGIGSAYVLTRYCKEHNAFRWICGNVEIERKTISDFRVANADLFDSLLAQSIAVLLKQNLVSLKEISQDGIRVRASAGKSSFRREKTLNELLVIAKNQVKQLRKELEEDPNTTISRQKSAKKQTVEDRKSRVEASLSELEKLKKITDQNRVNNKKKKLTEDEKQKLRVSTTDCEARIMKMGDSGFRPAYNIQLATDTYSQVIVGIDVFNTGSDAGLLLPMYEQFKQKFLSIPERWLCDGGFKNKKAIEIPAQEGCLVYLPKEKKKIKSAKDTFVGNSKLLKGWSDRMESEEGKEIYKRRASTSECVNALARQRGLYQFTVRGIGKVKSVVNIFSIVHNMMRSFALRLN